MSGLVVAIGNDTARYQLFTACMLKLEVPTGTKKEILIGGDWCGARNKAAERKSVV